MEYIEYPKALYLKGDYLAVANVAEEEAARAAGYTDWAEDYAAYGIPAEPGSAPAPEAAPEATATTTTTKSSRTAK